MGEMADMHLDQAFDDLNEGGDEDEDEDEDDHATCNRCGTKNLHWQEIVKGDGTPGHALFNKRNRKHVCPIPDDFDVVPE